MGCDQYNLTVHLDTTIVMSGHTRGSGSCHHVDMSLFIVLPVALCLLYLSHLRLKSALCLAVPVSVSVSLGVIYSRDELQCRSGGVSIGTGSGSGSHSGWSSSSACASGGSSFSSSIRGSCCNNCGSSSGSGSVRYYSVSLPVSKSGKLT